MCIGRELGLKMKIFLLSLIVYTICTSAACADKPIGLNSFDRFDYSKAEEFVLDKATSLTWRSCAIGQVRVKGKGCQGDLTEMGWSSAKAMEKSEWRLPTKDELTTLIDRYSNQEKLIPRIVAAFPAGDITKLNYWTSDSAGASEAWYVNFGLGLIAGKADKNSQFAVRLVKGTFVPPAPEIKPPQDIYFFLGRRDDCKHFVGEFAGEPNSKERDRQIDKTMTEMRCNRIEADEKKLRKKYRAKPDMLKW